MTHVPAGRARRFASASGARGVASTSGARGFAPVLAETVALGLLLAATVALAHAEPSLGPAATGAAPSRPAATPSAATATHFSHAWHAAHVGDNVAVSRCETCHRVDAAGVVAAPAAQGHAPCLSAGCHASYFLATSAATKQADPARYAKATAFCLGCHDSNTGAPPAPWQKPPTSAALRSFQYEREYHVEMNHEDHGHRAGCRTCHVVDPASFALVASAPGHAQCVTCHNPQKFPQFTMASCGLCHDKPARAEYFAGSRPKVDVRACGGEGHTALEAKLRRSVPCFRHEREEHRTLNGAAVQCAACHYIVADKAAWGKRRYQTLHDLHVHPIIDNTGDREHRSCGQSAACHKVDVDAGRAGANCALCHAEKSAF